MKKIIGILAATTLLSFVLIGCSQPVEGDTAPAPDTKKADTPKGETSKAETPTAPSAGS